MCFKTHQGIWLLRQLFVNQVFLLKIMFKLLMSL